MIPKLANQANIMSRKIDFNKQFQCALELMENSSRHVFVTGRAGTGKSTLLNHFRVTTKKKIAVVAPTGVAAVNIAGVTIHSFFGFKPNITLVKVKKLRPNQQKIYKKIDAIVIDEISMVRADLLDCVDKFLRLNGKNKNLPFGGVQMIFIGDLYQLPPVITGNERAVFKNLYETEYFFSSRVLQNFAMEFVELEKIYRQHDQKFIELLNKIRNNSVELADLVFLNKRLQADFQPAADDFYVYLVPTNDLAKNLNNVHLLKIKGKNYYFRGEIEGNFDEKYLPTDVDLNLKIGSQIMMLNNDAPGRWINGTIGKITAIKKNEGGGGDADDTVITAELENGQKVEIRPYKWTIFNYHYNVAKQSLETETVGSFTQFPLKLAWAMTIHKSQGKTFNKVILDMGRGAFAHGQTYVALSRCISLTGLVLKKEIKKQHIFVDWKVSQFVTKFQYKISEKRMPLEQKVAMLETAIKNKQKLEIVYLKARDEKSKRVISPRFVGELEYAYKPFLGVEAFCHTRGEERVFRVDRILEMREAI